MDLFIVIGLLLSIVSIGSLAMPTPESNFVRLMSEPSHLSTLGFEPIELTERGAQDSERDFGEQQKRKQLLRAKLTVKASDEEVYEEGNEGEVEDAGSG